MSKTSEASDAELMAFDWERERQRAIAMCVHPCITCGKEKLPPNMECESCRTATEFRARVREGLLDAQIPRSLEWASFESPLIRQRVDARALEALEALESLPQMLVLRGPAGVGKSVLAAATLRRAIERDGCSALWADSFALSVARVDAPLGQTPRLEDRAKRDRLIVIDDLVAEKSVPSSPVADVLFHRHAQEKVTIVTTAATPAQIATKYGDGVARRVLERALVLDLRPRRSK